MKKALTIIILFSVIAGMALAQPALPHRVYGNITSGGQGVGCLDVSFRDDGSYIEAHSDKTDEGTGFYDIDINRSKLSDGKFVYLNVNGQRTSKYINFSAGSSTVLNHAGDYTSQCGGGSGGSTLTAEFSYSYLSEYVVRFDGGNSGPDIQEYRWDWNGDGTYENTTSDPDFTHDYGENLSETFNVELEVYNRSHTETYSEPVEIPDPDTDGTTSGGTGGGSSGGGSSGTGGSGSGSPSGGGGGLLPGGDTKEPEKMTVSTSLGGDGSSNVSIDSVDKNQAVQVNVEGDSSLSGLSFTAGSSNENVVVSVSSSAVRPQGVEKFSAGPAYRYYTVELENLMSFSEGKVGFQVSKSWLNSRNRSQGDVVFKSYDGFSWHSLDTSVVGETIASYSYEAETSVLGTFAAGLREEKKVVKRAKIQVTEFNVSREGKKVSIEAVVRNKGNAAGERTLYLSKNSEFIRNETVSLAPGGKEKFNYDVVLSGSGSYIFEMASKREEISIKSSSSMFLVFAGAGVIAVITLLIGIIYYRETKRANELEDKIRNIENQGNQSMQNLQRNLNDVQKSIRGNRQQSANRRQNQQSQNQGRRNNQRKGNGNQNQSGNNNHDQGNNSQQGSNGYGDRRDDGL